MIVFDANVLIALSSGDEESAEASRLGVVACRTGDIPLKSKQKQFDLEQAD